MSQDTLLCNTLSSLINIALQYARYNSNRSLLCSEYRISFVNNLRKFRYRRKSVRLFVHHFFFCIFGILTRLCMYSFTSTQSLRNESKNQKSVYLLYIAKLQRDIFSLNTHTISRYTTWKSTCSIFVKSASRQIHCNVCMYASWIEFLKIFSLKSLSLSISMCVHMYLVRIRIQIAYTAVCVKHWEVYTNTHYQFLIKVLDFSSKLYTFVPTFTIIHYYFFYVLYIMLNVNEILSSRDLCDVICYLLGTYIAFATLRR